MQSLNVAAAAGVLNLLVLLSLVISYIFFLPLLRSPLRRVPNAHWSCGLSPVWIWWIRYRGRELAVLEEKHRQLGPIVRVGPADLSISCYDGVRAIYNGGFEKPQYYNFFAYFERKNAFCSLTRQDHSLRRKRITPAYTKSALFASESLFSLTQTILLERLLPNIQHQALTSQPTEILSMSYALCLDLLTCFQFGLASGSNFLEDQTSLTPWLHHYEQRYCKEAFWPQELPTLTRCLKFFGINMLPKSQPLSTKFLEDWLLELCERAESVGLDVDKGRSIHAADLPIVYQLVKKGVDADIPDASFEARRDEIASELFDQMSGGREVLGLVLAYTIYYISQNPAAQAQLRDELATLDPSLNKAGCTSSEEEKYDAVGGGLRLPPPSSLDKLPYLSAIIQESLRMRPNSTPLPRITPRDRPVTLAGIHDIPGGVRVNTFQWFIHRNPENYARVNEWHPERWLEESKDGQKPLLWAFGGGSRMCVGVSLTQYLMRYILAVLYSNFTSKLVSKRYGVHDPGSPEDEIVVQFEPISKLHN